MRKTYGDGTRRNQLKKRVNPTLKDSEAAVIFGKGGAVRLVVPSKHLQGKREVPKHVYMCLLVAAFLKCPAALALAQEQIKETTAKIRANETP
jgi:hypothetical protein